MIRLENIAKKFPDGNYGVIDINIHIPDNDFLFLIGSSGAGKTTLLKLLSGQTHPSEGTIFFDDLDLSKVSKNKLYKVRRAVGVVYQDFKLLPDYTVYENVALALEVVGKNEKDYKSHVYEVIEKVGLAGKEFYFPAQLSGGQIQRTAIARAIAAGTKHLIADEPTGDLDPQTAREVLSLLDQLNKSGTTIIIATHNHGIVDEMKKRVVVLEHGRITSDSGATNT